MIRENDMTQGFNAEMKCQREWGWLLSIWLFMSGTACGLFLLYQVANLPAFFGSLAIVLLVLGGGVLLLEQGSPLRAWRAVSRISTSWLSRGVVFVCLFLASGILAIAPDLAPGLPWGGALAKGLAWIAGLSALFVVLYPGFFLANNRSVPFWYTPMMPALLVLSAAMGASALVLVGSGYLKNGLAPYGTVAAVTIVANFIFVCVYLIAMDQAGSAAKESVRLLNHAPMAWIFWGGVVVIGMGLPLVLLLWVPAGLGLAGVCMLIGCFLLRYCLLKVGVYVPAALVQQGLDFSRLNRSSSELEREYAGAAAPSTPARG